MGNALQEQLLKAGLVSDKQLKKARKEQRTERLQTQGRTSTADDNKLRAQQALAEKAERDRELNRLQKEAQEEKAIAAQIKQLVETNRQPRDDGDVPYNFADDNKVKRIYVTERVREQISGGRLAIVKVDKRYELVPAEIAEKIRARNAGSVIVWNDPKQAPEETPDNGYANYKIPDDLMW